MPPSASPAALGLQAADYAVIVAYLAVVVGLGAWFSRGAKDTESYLLGGRRMAWWLIGVSYVASLISTISMVGAPGEAYKNGLTAALWPIFGVFLSLGFFFLFIRFYFQTRTFTPFAYLERRFGAGCRAWAAGIYCLARALYLATVLFAAAKVFEGTSNWPLSWTILVIGGVGIFYTTLGGMQAVVWTEFFQFLVIVGGIGVIVVKIAGIVPGGLWGVFQYAARHDHLFPEFKDPAFFSLHPYARLTFWAIVLRAAADHLFYKSADQILIQRMLATKGYWQAFRSVAMGSVLGPAIVLILYGVGLCLFRFYADVPPADRPPPDLALFRFITTELPSPLPGLIVAAMLAAIMSTLDSGMNSLAAVLTKDFYHRFWHAAADEATQVRFSRAMTVASGTLIIAAALGIAQLATSVNGTVLESSGVWMSLLVVLAPVFLLGVTSRRAGSRQVLAAMTTGLTATVLMTAWYYRVKNAGGEAGFHMVAVTSFLSTLAAGYGLSFFARRRDPAQLENQTLWTLEKNGQQAVAETRKSS